MFGFFEEVNIRLGRDCYGMWIILRAGISSLLGGQNNKLGVHLCGTIRYVHDIWVFL